MAVSIILLIIFQAETAKKLIFVSLNFLSDIDRKSAVKKTYEEHPQLLHNCPY